MKHFALGLLIIFSAGLWIHFSTWCASEITNDPCRFLLISASIILSPIYIIFIYWLGLIIDELFLK